MDVATPALEVELRQVRVMGGAMLAAGVLLRALPVRPSIACPLLSTTGIPCPFCGMTRSVISAVHGEVAQSLRFHPAGILLIIGIVVAFAAYRTTRLRITRWLVPAIIAAMWAWNLTLNPTFH